MWNDFEQNLVKLAWMRNYGLGRDVQTVGEITENRTMFFFNFPEPNGKNLVNPVRFPIKLEFPNLIDLFKILK